MQWQAFVHDNQTYDLTHLWSRTTTYEWAAQGNKPGCRYNVEIDFGLHCFTKGRIDGQDDRALLYSDAREVRVFDFQRHELSKLLPEIVDGLATRKCYHTGKGNFFSLEATIQKGEKVDYEIFFEASRTTKKGVLRLFVQSAYIRDRRHNSNAPKRRPIRLM
jgi:hypothetical protein